MLVSVCLLSETNVHEAFMPCQVSPHLMSTTLKPPVQSQVQPLINNPIHQIWNPPPESVFTSELHIYSLRVLTGAVWDLTADFTEFK